jgi:uncharacterized membrane protein HdeD (DUF308 family)
MNHLLHLAGDIAVWVALVSAIAFCVTYAVVAPWRRSGEGWHLMTFTAVIGLAFGWIAYRQTTSTPAPLPLPTELARALILVSLASLLMWRFGLLIRTQMRRRRR